MKTPPPLKESTPAAAPRDPGGAAAALVADDAELDSCMASLGATVGVDTEFMRVRTFYPVPALYQLAGDGGVVLVDAQAPARFTSLKALLLDPARLKIMHSCSEDLEVMARHLELRPVHVVDTQVAHAFLTPHFSASYAKLVEHYLGIGLPKHETRSDWLRRPLTPEQIAYAQEDAVHLGAIWTRQRQALAACGRLDWLIEDMQRTFAASEASPDTWYRSLRGAWRLSSGKLAVLRSLVRWRETEARRRDAPRTWVVADEALLAMARRDELDAEAAAQLLPRRVGARYGRALARAHRQGRDDPAPPPRLPSPLSRRAGETVKRLRAVAVAEAERLGMAPELTARKRDIEALVRYHREHGELPDSFRGWRRNLLGDAFRDLLAG